MSGFGGGAHSLGCVLNIVDRIVTGCGGVFNRAADEPGFRAKPDRLSGVVGVITKAVLEIGAHGQVSCSRHLANVSDHPFAADGVVSLPDRERVSGACCRESFEPEMGQQSRGADVPRIWNDECAIAFVKRTKGDSFFCLSSHSFSTFARNIFAVSAGSPVGSSSIS